MATASVSFDGSGQDGMFLWWAPGSMRVGALREALSNVGLEHLAPKSSTIPAAMKEMLSGFIEAANLKVRGLPIDINPLRSDVKGFEAVQRHPGDTQNQHQFLISVVLDEVTAKVKIAQFNPSFFNFGGNQTAVEDRMTAVFYGQLDWFPTPMVSSCISRVVAHLGGILCRKAGGVYFLPESAMSQFEPLADELELAEGGVELTLTKFDLRPGERSYRLVAQSINAEIKETLASMEESLKLIGKQRANGKESRTAALKLMADKIKKYEDILGITLTELRDAVIKVQGAVDAHAAIDDLGL
jgi:hypothetical protein